ncbi:resistin-like beta [Lithobates pipiens]
MAARDPKRPPEVDTEATENIENLWLKSGWVAGLQQGKVNEEEDSFPAVIGGRSVPIRYISVSSPSGHVEFLPYPSGVPGLWKMKLLLCFFLLSAVTAETSTCVGECCQKDVVSLTNLMKSMASTILENTKLDCYDHKTNGAYSTCPPEYSTTGCACGFGCGSWDIQSERSCHCQCAFTDWTTARCCRLKSK